MTSKNKKVFPFRLPIDDKYQFLRVHEYEEIMSIKNLVVRDLVADKVIELRKEQDQIMLCIFISQNKDALTEQEVTDLMNQLVKISDLRSQIIDIIVEFSISEDDQNFYKDHALEIARNDIINLKSQIQKLKDDRKNPFLTEDQIKCFG